MHHHTANSPMCRTKFYQSSFFRLHPITPTPITPTPITPTDIKFPLRRQKLNLFSHDTDTIIPTYHLIIYLHKYGNFQAICSRIYSHYTDTHYTDGYKIPITLTEDFIHYTDTHYTDIPSNFLSIHAKFPIYV